MSRTKIAKEYMEQFKVGQNNLSEAFPEFEAVKNNLLYGEIRQEAVLDEKLKMLITVAALITTEGNDLKEQCEVALKKGVEPIELQEVFHQSVPYIGFAKAEKGLLILQDVLKQAGVSLPLATQQTVTEEDRLEKGIAAQKSLFGPAIDAMRANAPENQKAMQDYLSAYCFGDTYTRTGLSLKDRELLTFVCIICLGGCDSQANSHAMGNLLAGNDADVLVAAITQCLPYIGFPRTLNAIAALTQAQKTIEQMKAQTSTK